MEILFIGGPAHGKTSSISDPPPAKINVPVDNGGPAFDCCIYTVHAVHDPEGIRRWVAVSDAAMLDAMVAVGFCEREH